MLSNFDARKLKAMAIEMWKRGGLDTLVKVCPHGTTPDPGRATGYCTTFKFIVGRTPVEIEEIVGLAKDSKLFHGADIFVVDPLPLLPQFELRGYSQCPAGVSTSTPGYIPHPGYPPGLGAPQWELSGYPQSGLKLIASVLTGQRFTYLAARLPPRR
jgi:hypothetical protein